MTTAFACGQHREAGSFEYAAAEETAGIRMNWRVEMFGGLRIVRGQETLGRLQPTKPGALLAYLVYYPASEHTREELLELLWPDADPAAGRNRLKQTLSTLRGALEAIGVSSADLLIADRTTIRVNQLLVTSDVATFEDAGRRAALTTDTAERLALLALAAKLYKGPLMPGLYEDWAVFERERLVQLSVEGLLALSTSLKEINDLPQAISSLTRALAADPLREDIHLALMRLYVEDNRPDEALRQYGKIDRIMREELQSRPSHATQAVARAIRDGGATGARQMLPAGQKQVASVSRLEPLGGAVPLSSEFYIVRHADAEFGEALACRDSIVLVKGPRATGKTSLLARGLQQARESGASVVMTDLQQMTPGQIDTAEGLFLNLAESMADQLGLDPGVTSHWDPDRGWNVNFERFLRRGVLQQTEAAVVWGMDEVDRLFTHSYAGEVFALFRSWHNLRSLTPAGPWSRLTLAMAYATEAHLFITDLNQSPFNVGTRLSLEDFTLEQVADLNRRHGSPLRDAADLTHFIALLGGCPYLVRQGLHQMVSRKLDVRELEIAVRRDDGMLHDHLARMLLLISQDAGLQSTVREVLRTGACTDARMFYRLRSAGVLAGEAPTARFRCSLYADYLDKYLP
jgi:DNA-binding SARP family transcriptional activator